MNIQEGVMKESHKKPYEKPEIIYEIELETTAGSPAGDELPPGLDLLP